MKIAAFLVAVSILMIGCRTEHKMSREELGSALDQAQSQMDAASSQLKAELGAAFSTGTSRADQRLQVSNAVEAYLGELNKIEGPLRTMVSPPDLIALQRFYIEDIMRDEDAYGKLKTAMDNNSRSGATAALSEIKALEPYRKAKFKEALVESALPYSDSATSMKELLLKNQ